MQRIGSSIRLNCGSCCSGRYRGEGADVGESGRDPLPGAGMKRSCICVKRTTNAADIKTRTTYTYRKNQTLRTSYF